MIECDLNKRLRFNLDGSNEDRWWLADNVDLDVLFKMEYIEKSDYLYMKKKTHRGPRSWHFVNHRPFAPSQLDYFYLGNPDSENEEMVMYVDDNRLIKDGITGEKYINNFDYGVINCFVL